jgi:hypothetical protein
MTKKELIEALKDFPDDMPIFTSAEYGGDYWELDKCEKMHVKIVDDKIEGKLYYMGELPRAKAPWLPAS